MTPPVEMTNLLQLRFRIFLGNAELSSRPERTRISCHGAPETTTLYGTVTLSLSSRPERSGAEGPAVPQTLRGDVFQQPGFPDVIGGVGELHAAFLTESRTRGRFQCCVAVNPGTLRSR